MTDRSEEINEESREIMEKIINKLISIKKSIIEDYKKIREKSKMDHSIKIVDDLINMETNDIRILSETEIKPEIMYSQRKGREEDYRMLDHIINSEEKPKADDPRSILSWRISISDYLYKMELLMAQEYEDKNVSDLLKNLAESEKKRKNRITEIYEELINGDSW
ncbi:hypothetical protein [Caldiplasma sukawensis]